MQAFISSGWVKYMPNPSTVLLKFSAYNKLVTFDIPITNTLSNIDNVHQSLRTRKAFLPDKLQGSRGRQKRPLKFFRAVRFIFSIFSFRFICPDFGCACLVNYTLVSRFWLIFESQNTKNLEVHFNHCLCFFSCCSIIGL